MQSAVDMAALVGAQDLPCSDATCVANVEDEAYWCAMSNFYGGSVPGNSGKSCASTDAMAAVTGSVTVTPSVPPNSCSPYSTIDYGSNSHCPNRTSTNSGNGFIEVDMTQTLQIPIFNFTFDMHAHAIARHGEPSPKDFAMTILNPTLQSALKLSGTKSNGLIVVGSVMSDSTSTSGGGSIDTGGSAGQVSCDGGWYTAASESVPAQLYSATGGQPVFAPPGCLASSGQYCVSSSNAPAQPPCDTTTVWHPNWPYIEDPYCASSNPPTDTTVTATTDCRGAATTSTMSNCTPCTATAQVFIWNVGSARTTGTWTSAASLGQLSGGQNVEFFPGIYPKGISMSVAANKSAQVYFNPGVYTLEGDLSVSGQTQMCIYGSPACDNFGSTPPIATATNNSSLTCQDADFTPTTSAYYVSSSTWFYYCSPWGQWDATALPNRTVTKTAPTFTDGKTPLNGVTFYLTNAANFKMTGGGFAELAFPNPCPGTATSSTSPALATDSVPFYDPASPGAPAGVAWGSSSFGYTYDPTVDGAAYEDGNTTSTSYVYPNPDLSYDEEQDCINPNTAPVGTTTPLNAGNEWTDEFGQANGVEQTQHLHFLVFARDGSSSIQLAGNGGQNWYGILYNPGSPTTYGTSGCSNTSKCTTTLTGSSGATAGHGPPMMVGQVVADNLTYSGSAVTELFYRPCNPQTAVCNSGPGSGLVQ